MKGGWVGSKPTTERRRILTPNRGETGVAAQKQEHVLANVKKYLERLSQAFMQPSIVPPLKQNSNYRLTYAAMVQFETLQS